MSQLILFGHTGVLGDTVLRRARDRGSSVLCVDSRKAFSTLHDGFVDLPAEAEQILRTSEVDVICASGIVDPRTPLDELVAANAKLPHAIYRSVTRAAREHAPERVRFLTVGSVMENHADLSATNSYIQSKRELLRLRVEADATSSSPWLHVQLHTLYGGFRSHSFMFMGQIERALRGGTEFRMSAGAQLREYHHADDIADNMLGYLNSRTSDSEVIDMSAGEGVPLRELARGIFEHFGRLDLLQVGALPGPGVEIYENRYQRSIHLHRYRDPIPGVVEWLESRDIRRPGR